jgi:hypothetical protein
LSDIALRREHKVIAFSPTLPDVTKSQPIRAFLVGQYLALLLEKPKPLMEGSLIYLYALVVGTKSESDDIAMIVTSELTSPEVREMMRKTMEIEQTTDPFLCVFDEKGGHHNLGYSPRWANQEQFVTRALELVRDRLKVASAPVEVKPGGVPVEVKLGAPVSSDSSASQAWTLKQYLLLGVGAVIVAMLAFPPFRVLSSRGAVVETGYAFIFDLPSRASVDVGQLLVQWVGVLTVGAIAFLFISSKRQ